MMFGMSDDRRGHLAAERAHRAGERLNPNRWIGKSWDFRQGFESTWEIMEFVAQYDRGETDYVPPIYGLCRVCDWPLEDDQPEHCRKCDPGIAGRNLAGRGFRRLAGALRKAFRHGQDRHLPTVESSSSGDGSAACCERTDREGSL